MLSSSASGVPTRAASLEAILRAIFAAEGSGTASGATARLRIAAHQQPQQNDDPDHHCANAQQQLLLFFFHRIPFIHRQWDMHHP